MNPATTKKKKNASGQAVENKERSKNGRRIAGLRTITRTGKGLKKVEKGASSGQKGTIPR